MKQAPRGWLFTSAEDCCTSHYMWDVQECRKNSLGSPKWYPNFDTGEGGCKNDGQEPLYMRRYVDYLFDSQEECCMYYYEWNVDACMNPALAPDPCDYTYMEIYNEDFLLADPDLDAAGYYPDYEGDDQYCLNDGNAPEYMNASPKAWRHKTLSECCLANFQFVFRECMGYNNGDDGELAPLSPCAEPLPPASEKWYVEYYSEADPVCVQDCDGEFPCNGRTQSYKELYDTYSECCERHLWYLTGCP